MPLANYTTEVPAMKSVGEIQGMLISHKAKIIRIDYEQEKPVAISFMVNTSNGDIPFRLPTNVLKVRQLLIDMRIKKPPEWSQEYKVFIKRIDEQAYRVSWRILRDWVRAQMAIIETEMVALDEVFLPYMLVNGETLYNHMLTSGFPQLTQGEGEK